MVNFHMIESDLMRVVTPLGLCKQEHGQKDLNWGKEDVKARQASRRLKLLMRRLREDERETQTVDAQAQGR